MGVLNQLEDHKGFYNYLAARNLYFGGMSSWIKVTLYYSKFYLARSILTLIGKSVYRVNRASSEDIFDRIASSKGFVEEIAKALVSKDGKRQINSYRIQLGIDISAKAGEIILDKKGLNHYQLEAGRFLGGRLEVDNLKTSILLYL